jgi:hypothetical protein
VPTHLLYSVAVVSPCCRFDRCGSGNPDLRFQFRQFGRENS